MLPTALPRAILFDMDGTLTRPVLDFPAIKREMGIGDQPILEALAVMNADRRAVAQAILHRHEEHAASNALLNDGCEELLHWLNERDIPFAVITRNSRASANTVFALHNIKPDLLIARDSGLPHKPDPAPLLHACATLDINPTQAWMVGDGEFDILAAERAGIPSVWISHDRPKPFACDAWRTVADMVDLLALLRVAHGHAL